MKISTFIVLALIAGILFIQFSPAEQITKEQASMYPVAVKAVIDKKCYGCHSVKGKSQDAKDALMWDSLPGLPKIKIVATLDDMIEVLEKNEMPPEEVVKKYPEMRLLPEENELLRSWAEVKADSLLK
jgi:mono/diheme cytochrome c family protein